MSKRKHIALVVIVVILVLVEIYIYISNQNKVDDDKITNISSDSFYGMIINKEANKLIVIPNEDELIRKSSFSIVDVMFNDKTEFISNGESITLDDFEKNQNVKIEFDGKIYEANPAKIIAQKVELILDKE